MKILHPNSRKQLQMARKMVALIGLAFVLYGAAGPSFLYKAQSKEVGHPAAQYCGVGDLALPFKAESRIAMQTISLKSET
jgi:hypothetical protein